VKDRLEEERVEVYEQNQSYSKFEIPSRICFQNVIYLSFGGETLRLTYKYYSGWWLKTRDGLQPGMIT
jgi:hypothetical protein